MRLPSRRVTEVLLAGACALLLGGSLGAFDPPLLAAPAPSPAPGRSLHGTPVERAYVPDLVDHPVSESHEKATTALDELVASGRHWRLDTPRGPVHVWAPQGYDPETAVTVAYVHGYWIDADTAWFGHRLPEQFALSGINALFVVCEAPQRKWDPIAWPSLTTLLQTVKRGIDVAMPKGRVAAIGHSGAYRTVLQWIHDRRLDTLVLLDAAYVDVMPYRWWVLGAKHRRLINVSEDTVRWSDRLHRTLPGTLVFEGFPTDPTPMRDERIVYVRSELGHWALAKDGVALPTLLRALEAPRVVEHDLPLGLPPIDTHGLPFLE